MADAQARFIIDIDSAPAVQGARKAGSALEQLRARIQTGQKSLDALRQSIQRMRGLDVIVRYEKLTAGLDKARKDVDKFERQLAVARENLEIGKQANVRPEDLEKLNASVEGLEAKFNAATERAGDLKKKLDELVETDPNVAAFADLKAREEAGSKVLGDLQTQYEAAGGSAADLAEKVKEPTEGIDRLSEVMSAAGVPGAGLVSTLKNVMKAGGAAPILALVAAIVALTVAVGVAVVKIAQFALASADAARSAGLLKQAAAWGDSAGVEDITKAVAALRENTAATKDEATKLATELYRSGLRGKALEDAALTMERFGALGEETKGQIKSLYEQLQKPVPSIGGAQQGFAVTRDMLPKDVFERLAQRLGKDTKGRFLNAFMAKREDIANALKGLADEGPLKDIGRAQAIALSTQLERLKENWDSLFKNLKIDGLLGALSKVTALLDENSVTGKALRKILEVVFQPLADGASHIMPIVEAFFQGATVGALLFLLVALKIRNAVRKLLPDDVMKKLDLAEVAFYAGAFAIGAFITALGLLAAVAAAVGISLALVTAPIWIPFVLGAAAVFLMYKGLKAIQGAFDKDAWKSAGDNIIGGLVEALESGAQVVVDAVKGLAEKALKAFTVFNDIHSPSKLYRRTARWIPAGAARGIEDGADEVEDAAADMLTPPSLAAPGTVGAAGGGEAGAGITVRVDNVTVKIDAPNLRDPEALLDESFLMRVATKLLNAMTASAGGAPATVVT
jgi:hypothetical protein